VAIQSNIFHCIPFFAHLSHRERSILARELVETRYRKGEFIFHEGEPATCFHVLAAGAVKCTKTSPAGKQVTLKILLPGDLFCCDTMVLTGSCYPGSAQPIEEATVLSLRKETYYHLLRRNPDTAFRVIEYLSQRLHEAQGLATALALNSAEQRLAALLLKLASQVGLRKGRQVRLTVPLTRQDLADLIGVTLETATRLMCRFKREALVSGTAKSLVIHDLTRLEERAAQSPAFVSERTSASSRN
jgi:CRP/FNR family transcriptional regulator